MTKQKCSFGRNNDVNPFFDRAHYHICNSESVKLTASPNSPLVTRIKAMLPACRTQSNLPW